MPYINLIQEQRLAAQTGERKARSFFFLFVGVLVASGVGFGFFSMDSLITNNQAKIIEDQNKKSAPLVKQIQANGQALADLTPRLKTLQDAAEMTTRWDHVLNHLVFQTPPSTWLTGLRCSASDPTKPVQISFIGVGASQSPIGEFILRLQNLKELDNVNLKYTNEKVVASSKAIEFEIDADLAGTATQKVKTESTGDTK
jgi:Tfp pilus assembly protein PilN